MPQHLALFDDDDNPAADFAVSMTAGTESAPIVRKIFNDKDDEFPDTTTAQGIRLRLLAEIGGKYKAAGVPPLDERWARIKVTHYIAADGTETTNGATGTVPFGVNAELPINDLAPQEGVRVEMYFVTPGGQTLDATKFKLNAYGNLSSSPLAQFTSLATGAGVVPSDRVSALRSILDGSIVTANNSATVTISRGHQVYDGTVITFLQSTQTFNLNDGDGVALAAGQSYRVTLSRDAAGAVVVTKGPKAEALLYPSKPAANIFITNLTVVSADGVAVTVAPASVLQSAMIGAEFRVRAGVGLTALVARGDGIGSDLRQYLSNEIPVPLTANSVNRIWRLPDGQMSATATDVPPQFDSDLLARATTDASAVTVVEDVRRFTHRTLTEWAMELTYADAFSDLAVPAQGLDLGILHFDGELDSVELNLTAKDATWTGGGIKIDIRTFAVGAAVPFPAGGAGVGGVTIYTNSGADDQRPSIAWNAATLRVVGTFHEVRRFVAGTRFVLDIISTVAAPAPEPEQEIRVTLHFRRYR